MPRIVFSISVIVLIVATTAVNAQESNTAPQGWVALFNGKDLEGWTGGTTRNPLEIKALSEEEAKVWREKMDQGVAAHWRVEDGQLVSDGHEPHLVTLRDFGNFEMTVDWKLSPKGDSGIYLRGCPQVQIWDPTNEADHKHGADKGSGGLWNNEKAGKDPIALADKPIGQWNRMVIRMVGPYVTVVLNGKTVIRDIPLENYYDRNQAVPSTGPIHLQTHGSETRFRNVFIREIDEEESKRLLAQIHQAAQGSGKDSDQAE